MAKRSLIEQLDEALEAIITRRDAALPPVDPKLSALLGVAADLRDLPREDFRERLKDDLQRKGLTMTSAKPTGQKFMPEGFHSITPYMQVEGAARLIEFVKQAFEAEEIARVPLPDGSIMHAEVRIGDSMVEMADAGGQFKPTPTAIHLYVPDADAVYKRALQAGASSIREPQDQFYGERIGGVRDPLGNNWYIATYQGATFIPEGLRSLTLCLHPQGAAKLIDFLESAFGAEVSDRYESPVGTIAHAKVRIGDSIIEMGEAHEEFQPMPSAIHLYVNDPDTVYKTAIQAGAASLFEPRDEPYGDRVGGVTDPFGNYWYIAKHVKDVSAENPG